MHEFLINIWQRGFPSQLALRLFLGLQIVVGAYWFPLWVWAVGTLFLVLYLVAKQKKIVEAYQSLCHRIEEEAHRLATWLKHNPAFFIKVFLGSALLLLFPVLPVFLGLYGLFNEKDLQKKFQYVCLGFGLFLAGSAIGEPLIVKAVLSFLQWGMVTLGLKALWQEYQGMFYSPLETFSKHVSKIIGALLGCRLARFFFSGQVVISSGLAYLGIHAISLLYGPTSWEILAMACLGAGFGYLLEKSLEGIVTWLIEDLHSAKEIAFSFGRERLWRQSESKSVSLAQAPSPEWLPLRRSRQGSLSEAQDLPFSEPSIQRRHSL